MSTKNIKIDLNFEIFSSINALSKQEKKLYKAAQEAALKAYAPYSNFKVGASILLDNQKIISGNNQENVAYPSGLCAERVAMYYIGANFPQQNLKAIAIVAMAQSNLSDVWVSPCGACRQAMIEYEQKQKTPIEMLFQGKNNEIIKSPSVAQLLPFVFNPEGVLGLK